MVQITLVVADMAGTTVRDDGLVDGAFGEALDALGIPTDHPDRAAYLEHVRRTKGMSKIVVFTELLGTDRGARANEAFEQAVARRVQSGGVSPLPGVEEAMAVLRASGCKICLTTGFAAATRDQILDLLGWGDAIDLALSPSSVVRGRPHPDLVFEAMARLGVADAAAVAVAGDTSNDVLCGRRAGARVVAGVLSGSHDRATLEQAGPTHLLESFADLPPVLSPAALA